jgi:spermidine synthase
VHWTSVPKWRTLSIMVTSFEVLDSGRCALGEFMLRRRRPISMPDTWVYEVKLNDHFLMSSLVRTSEEELARLALTRLDGQATRVLVGGLGLGYTAAAALAFPEVEQLEILEFLPEVIGWHERRLVPLGATLCGNNRCRIVQGDCFGRIRNGQAAEFDAVLIDIDDGPEEVLSSDHRSFYSIDGLRGARRCLRPGGVFGLWTSRPCDDEFLGRVKAAFGNGDAEEVLFHNPLLSVDEVNAIYLALA